jgi:L-lactate dehydrogenase complex protein LldG
MLWDGGRSLFVQQLFGAFISGPTKTADVDQSLLIGAHGTHTLTIHSLG